MTEWKLPGGEVATADRRWMALEHQPGFTQRTRMVTDLVALVTGLRPEVTTVTDLGCGDGSLLARLSPVLTAWGYELGAGDIEHARDCGRDVRPGDIVGGREPGDVPLEHGDLIIASEVLEHLADPVGFLNGLPDRLLIVSSPSAETGEWFNPIHSWAWDLAGYRELLEGAGWRVLYQAECDGGQNTFGGVTGPQRFQAIVGAR